MPYVPKEIYYGCHHHFGFTGKIVFDDVDGELFFPTAADDINLDKTETISEFEAECGAQLIDAYGEGTAVCDDKHFLCGSEGNAKFNACMKALDCMMHNKMAVHADASPVTTFLEQMIPHHVNAVQMAQVLLKFMTLEHFKYMPDGTPRSNEAATAEYNQIFDLAVEIINGQGAQILFMQLYQIGHSASFPEVRCLFGPPAGAEPEKACPRPFGGSTCYDSYSPSTALL